MNENGVRTGWNIAAGLGRDRLSASLSDSQLARLQALRKGLVLSESC